MYSVALANKDCIFDSASGFSTIKAANDWALKHGGHFHVMIENDEAEDGEYPVVEDYWK